MPKWGLSMETGIVNGWLKNVGDVVARGDELVEVETTKINSAVEAPFSGVLRRQTVATGDEMPVGALLGVVCAADVDEAAIDAVVGDFKVEDAPKTGEGADAAAPEKRVFNDYTLRFLKRGDADSTLLLLHGFGGDLNNWLFNHEALAAHHTVYALDLPGHGESTKALRGGDLDDLVATVAAFAEDLELPSLHVVGHSLGGAVALGFAKAHPERVASVTLVASAGLGEEIDGAYIEGFVKANSRSALKTQLAKLFAREDLVTRQLIDDVLKYKRLEGVEHNLGRLADSLFKDGRQAVSFRDDLATIAPRLHVIWGELDRVIPVTHAAAVPGRLQIIPNAGHMVQMEAASDVNRFIEASVATPV